MELWAKRMCARKVSTKRRGSVRLYALSEPTTSVTLEASSQPGNIILKGVALTAASAGEHASLLSSKCCEATEAGGRRRARANGTFLMIGLRPGAYMRRGVPRLLESQRACLASPMRRNGLEMQLAIGLHCMEARAKGRLHGTTALRPELVGSMFETWLRAAFISELEVSTRKCQFVRLVRDSIQDILVWTSKPDRS